MKALLVILILIANHVAAQAGHSPDLSPIGASDYCQKAARFGFFQEFLLTDIESRSAFKMQPSSMNLPACWWYTQMQRSATYLTYFRPDLPKPKTQAQVYELVKRIAKNEGVTEIPGYSNYYDFTNEWRQVFHEYLDEWQRVDLLWKQEWAEGFNEFQLSPEEVRRKMIELYFHVAVAGRIAHVITQRRMGPMGTHMINVVDMKPTSTGFILTIVDGNYPEKTVQSEYKYGDTKVGYEWPGVPYVKYTESLRKIENHIADFCRPYWHSPHRP